MTYTETQIAFIGPCNRLERSDLIILEQNSFTGADVRSGDVRWQVCSALGVDMGLALADR